MAGYCSYHVDNNSTDVQLAPILEDKMQVPSATVLILYEFNMFSFTAILIASYYLGSSPHFCLPIAKLPILKEAFKY